MQILQFAPDKPYWEAYKKHLEDCDQARWVLDDTGQPLKPELVFLGAMVNGHVAGNLTLLKQCITIPATEWADNKETDLAMPDGQLLYETFVQTFYVDEEHRKQGIGQALQEEALRQTKALGCWQMRSWSSLDKPANYQLKLKLGFSVHPAIYETKDGLKVSGAYFIRRV